VYSTIIRRIIDTEDAATRDALLRMGWTPPHKGRAYRWEARTTREPGYALVHQATGEVKAFLRCTPNFFKLEYLGGGKSRYFTDSEKAKSTILKEMEKEDAYAEPRHD
jgi:hypothetical protein